MRKEALIAALLASLVVLLAVNSIGFCAPSNLPQLGYNQTLELSGPNPGNTIAKNFVLSLVKETVTLFGGFLTTVAACVILILFGKGCRYVMGVGHGSLICLACYQGALIIGLMYLNEVFKRISSA